jgi:hypothetical protein
VPDHHSEAKGDCQSRSPTESAEVGFTYCFVPLSLHTRICGQSTCSFCCFGKPFTSFLAPAPTATTIATYLYPKPAARRVPALPTTTWLQGGVRSSYSQQYCTRVKAHILSNILLLKYFYFLCHFAFCISNENLVLISCNDFSCTKMKYIFFTDLRSSKVVPKGMQSQHRRSYKKVVPKGAQRKSFARKSFLRECRAKIDEATKSRS